MQDTGGRREKQYEAPCSDPNRFAILHLGWAQGFKSMGNGFFGG